MKINFSIKAALPHIVAVALFIIISFVYFYPVLEGKILRANDITVSNINAKEIRDYRAEQGKEPLWTNSIFSGMPAYLISTLYPGNLIKKADLLLRTFKTPVSMIFLAMLGFYIVMLIFRVNPWLAIAGAIAFGLSSYMFQIIAAGHNTKTIALAYMAPMIGAIYYTYRYDVIKGALMTAFILALEIVANHVQITYYGMICLLVFGIVEFIYALKNGTLIRFVKTSAILVIPFIIALGINFANLYTIYEYGKYSIRGESELVSENRVMTAGLNKDYITHWSYGIDETLNLLVPNFKGGSTKPFDRDSETVRVLRQNNASEYATQLPKYWGTQPGTEGPHYVGAIVIFLFMLGLVLVRGPEKWWLLSATILSVMLAWGKNFMFLTDLFIDYFPGYNKFRAVTMALVIAQFCIPLLGFIALRDIFNGTLPRKEILKGIKIAGGITGGFLILLLVIPGIAGSFLISYEHQYPEWLKDALIADRKVLLKTDTFRSLVFIILAAATILGLLFEKLKKEYAIIIITLLITIDLWSAGKRYLDADRFERPSAIEKSFEPTLADNFILEDPSYHRVLNLTVSPFNDNSPTAWFHKSIGGYHGAKLQRYQELIDSVIIDEIMLFSSGETYEDLIPVLDNTHVLSMLNTKYVILSPSHPPLVNDNARGNAWFAPGVIMVENANEELSALKIHASTGEAIVDKMFRDLVTRTDYSISEDDTFEFVSYQPNELIYKYKADGERLALFSEIYYPAGWKSFIDGIEIPHFRANYVLRGMVVPGGEHEIRFSFEPESFYLGNRISLASSILFILLIAGYVAISLKRNTKKE